MGEHLRRLQALPATFASSNSSTSLATSAAALAAAPPTAPIASCASSARRFSRSKGSKARFECRSAPARLSGGHSECGGLCQSRWASLRARAEWRAHLPADLDTINWQERLALPGRRAARHLTPQCTPAPVRLAARGRPTLHNRRRGPAWRPAGHVQRHVCPRRLHCLCGPSSSDDLLDHTPAAHLHTGHLFSRLPSNLAL